MNNQDKKLLLIRKNRCKQIRSNYILKITSLLNSNLEDIKFLGVEESDLIRKVTREKKTITSKTEKFIYSTEAEVELIKKIKETMTGEFYIFIDHDWEYCGAVYVDKNDCLNYIFNFGKYITDDIVLIDKDQEIFILMDYYEFSDEFFIDITIKKII